MSNNHPDDAHTGPIRTPKQLLLAGFFSFVIPIFAIIGLVLYVTAADKPAAGAVNTEKAIAERIQKVGLVEVRDANRPLSGGEAVYKAQCAACHATGAAGAPKLGEAAAWAERLKSGFDALVHSALKGKGAMPAQSGGDFNDTEIARAVAFLANSAGGKFEEPAAPAAAAAADGAAPADAAPAAAAAAPTAPAAGATPAPAAAAAPATAVAAGGAGEALYKQACQVCHAAGVAGAPKLGDKAAWSARLASGADALHASVINGKGAMPPRGGAMQASDADLRAAVEYMTASVK